LRIAALIFGLLAGLAAGLVLALGDIEAQLAAVPAFAPQGQFVARLLVYLVPAIGWIGTGMVLARPRLGGVLLLLSAIGWAALALAAGHGAVLFAAPPFTFALAAGIVAMFRRARLAARAPAESASAREPEPSRALAPPQRLPHRTDKSRPQLQGRANPELATTRTRIVDPAEPALTRPIPPPFRDDVAVEDVATDASAMEDAPPAGVPEEDPAAPIAAAMASVAGPPAKPPTDAPAPDSAAVEPATATADKEAEKEATTAGAEAASASATEEAATPPLAAPADSDAAALRARRPGDWALPTPAAPARTRYAAEQQSVPLARMTSVSVTIEPGAADAAQRPVPVEPVAAAIAVPPAAPEPQTEPAPPPPPSAADEPPETEEAAAIANASAATLDFAPVDEFGRGRVPPPERSRPAAAPIPVKERRRHRSRREVEDMDEPPVRRHGGIRAVLRGVIAAAFVAVVLGGAGAIYLDYLRGPQSLLFGHRMATRHATTPAAGADGTAAKPAVPPKPTTSEAKPADAATDPPGPTPQPPAATPAPAKADAPAPAAQTAPTAQATPAAAAAAPLAFTDPVRYCQTVRTIDAPDSHYTGPAVPPAVATALLIPKSTPASEVHWRCANGIALACNANGTHACDPTPTVQQMLDYCAKHPGASAMPAPNGSWSCNGTRPVIPEDQSWPVDARGFYPNAWVRVSPLGAG